MPSRRAILVSGNLNLTIFWNHFVLQVPLRTLAELANNNIAISQKLDIKAYVPAGLKSVMGQSSQSNSM